MEAIFRRLERTANVPECVIDLLVLDSFDIETNCRDCGYDLSKLQLVEQSGFP